MQTKQKLYEFNQIIHIYFKKIGHKFSITNCIIYDMYDTYLGILIKYKTLSGITLENLLIDNSTKTMKEKLCY